MAYDVQRRWDGQFFKQGSGAWTARDEYDVVGATTPAEALAVLAASTYALVKNAASPIAHPASSYVYLEDLDPQPAGFRRWIIHASWSSTPRGFHPNPGDPLNDPPVYQWRIGNDSEVIERDAYGNPILNAALDAFSEAATDEFTTFHFLIRRNEPIYNPTVALNYMNHCNLNAFTVLGAWNIAPGQALFRNYAHLTDASLLSPYTPVEYDIQFKAPYASLVDSDGLWDSFKKRILNQGIRGYWNNGGTKTLGDFCDGNGTKFSTDVRLYPNGTPMDATIKVLGNGSPQTPVCAPGATATVTSTALDTRIMVEQSPPTGTAIAYFLKYTRKPPIDFAPLHL